MECPKCGAEIDKNALVCPNCKKVLKIICPVCKTINTQNTCKKCGEILVTKCAKCGKINLLKNSHCVKCGFSNEISAVMGESNTDTFAVVRIDFPNSNVVKAKLGSNQLYKKFMANIDAMINTYVKTLNVRRQIIKGDAQDGAHRPQHATVDDEGAVPQQQHQNAAEFHKKGQPDVPTKPLPQHGPGQNGGQDGNNGAEDIDGGSV